MVVTDDDRVYTRLQSYHDTAACWRPARFAPEQFEGELFPGVNFRMSELCGAVMRAQLRRLDGLLERMRSRKARIKAALKGVKGIEFRRLADEAGDTAVCLMFYLKGPAEAKAIAKGLQVLGVRAASMYDAGIPDWHIYAHWKHIMDKRTITREGCPYTCPYYKGQAEYSPQMCPQTLDYLNRAVHIDIPPQMPDSECDEIAAALRKVMADATRP